jgi:serine/threonine-protein kinase HipA
MDADGEWRLSPAYDMTRSGYALGSGFRAAGVLGTFSKPGLKELRALAKSQGLRKTEDLIGGVLEAVGKWLGFAEQAGLSETEASHLQSEFPASRW